MNAHTSRRRFLAVAGAVSLAGCLGDIGGGGTEPDPNPTPERVAGLPVADATLPIEYGLDELADEVRSGGPGKDGIPSIDEPKFLPTSEADGDLDDGDVVFGVARDGESKAYLQNVLVWHEIVNDTVDGVPVSVTYCPLTGTVQGFERGGTTFGVSGKLLNNNLVMYDRETDSRWPQVLATAITGEHRGTSLREFHVTWTTWGRWRDAHPDTVVLSDETGSARDYSHDPYGTYNPTGGYYSSPTPLFPSLRGDDRYPAKEVFIGARPPEGAIGFRKASLREQGIMRVERGDTSYVTAYEPTLDTGVVYHDPEQREFSAREGKVEGPDGTYAPTDLPLDRVVAFDGMWHAWAGFYPSIEVAG